MINIFIYIDHLSISLISFSHPFIIYRLYNEWSWICIWSCLLVVFLNCYIWLLNLEHIFLQLYIITKKKQNYFLPEQYQILYDDDYVIKMLLLFVFVLFWNWLMLCYGMLGIIYFYLSSSLSLSLSFVNISQSLFLSFQG